MKKAKKTAKGCGIPVPSFVCEHGTVNCRGRGEKHWCEVTAESVRAHGPLAAREAQGPPRAPMPDEYPIKATWAEKGIWLSFDSPAHRVSVRFAKPVQLRRLASLALRVADAVENGYQPSPGTFGIDG